MPHSNSYKSQNQHTVPECYLKAWCDPDTPNDQEPFVWIVDKDGSNRKRKAPKNILAEPDFYTVEKTDGSQDPKIEQKLSQLESEFAQLRKTKLSQNSHLSDDEHISLMLFVAAGFARTVPHHNHVSGFFQSHLKKYDQLAAQLEHASPEEIAQWESLAETHPQRQVDDQLNENDIRTLAGKPVPHLLPIYMNVITKHLSYMNMTVFTTHDTVGFITSDSPVCMYDRQALTLAPPWNSPALGSSTVKVVMPISPHQCVFYTKGIFPSGYRKASKLFVDEFNRRHRFLCDSSFIVCRNRISDIWFLEEPIYPNLYRDLNK